jgi:hypothetical protein
MIDLNSSNSMDPELSLSYLLNKFFKCSDEAAIFNYYKIFSISFKSKLPPPSLSALINN